ncbi:uncharacterized protein LOC115539714 isoform X2 [Gadus morhua]|uniref:uncharacterized protein LOC115539714 isoform X2 n=1 Tax=Gadus morhua TaxID=8049 RepID=UPI0011B47AB9|nr:uncharacterized protein LOC115539714 isoform X2 [Gadus morhua]
MLTERDYTENCDSAVTLEPPLTNIFTSTLIELDEEEQQRYLNGSATEPRSLLLGPLRTYLGEDSHRARDMGKWGWRVDASRWSLQLLLLLASSLTLATDLPGLKCLCDFNTTISCDWNSSAQSPPITAATSCKLKAEKMRPRGGPTSYKSECDMRPRDPAHPALRACSLVLPPTLSQGFRLSDKWKMILDCESMNTTTIVYRPADYTKLKRPSTPEVNLTAVSLFSEVPRLDWIDERDIQLQWIKVGQPWGAQNITMETRCDPLCQMELTGLEKGEQYQARSRVRHSKDLYKSEWSDWSPVLQWVSAVGTEVSSTTDPPLQWEALVTAVVGAVVFLSLAIIVCKTDRETWVFMVKKISGPPLPNLDHLLGPEGKSPVWLKPGFPSESHHTLTALDLISSVEVTSRQPATLNLKASKHSRSAPLAQKLKAATWCSNPSYPHLLLHVEAHPHLKPCSADSPYGPMGGGAVGEAATGGTEEYQGEGGEGRAPSDLNLLNMIPGAPIGTTGSMKFCKRYEEVGEGGGSTAEGGSQGSESQEEEGEESPIEKLLSQGFVRGDIIGQGSLEVCLDYEKVGSLEVCLDYEKVGSLEVCLDHEKVSSPEVCLDYEKVGSPEVCLDYEMFKLLEGRAMSPDSGVGSGGEEQVSVESLEGVDFSLGTKTFTFPPLSGKELRLPGSLIESSPFFPGQGPSSSLSFNSEDGVSMTSKTTLLPSSGGYMPV